MFRCRSWALLLRQQCRGVPHALGDSRRTIAISAARRIFSRSVCQGVSVESVHAYFRPNNQRQRALSTVTYGARNRRAPPETPRFVRLLHDSSSDASERQGVHAENGLFSSRPEMPGEDEPLGKQELSGEEDLPVDASARSLGSKGRRHPIDLRWRKNGLVRRIECGSVRKIESSNHPGAHDHPFASELHSPEKDAPEYHLWPENLWRLDGNENSDQQDIKEIDQPDSQPSHVTTTPEIVGNSFEPVAGTPAKALHSGILAQETKISRLENLLFRFFTRLESLVDKKAPGKQILELFEAAPWLDAKIASTFGEEELDILGRALDVVAHDEFAEPNNFTIMGIKSTRFQTPKCLTIYQRWGLCRPCHWAAVLMKAAAGMSHSKRLMPPDDLEERFTWDIIIYLKTSSFLALWRAFLDTYHSPLVDTTVLARSRANNGIHDIHDSRRKSFQEAVFNQIPSWPLGDDAVQDQNIGGAFLLTIAFWSDLVAPAASRHLPTATLTVNLDEEVSQNQGTASTSRTELAPDIGEQDPGKWDLPRVMTRAIAPSTLNATWARLLLAKLSVPGQQARCILSDIAQLRGASRQGISLRSLDDALLAPSTGAVIAWLKTSRVDETRAFDEWLLRGPYQVHWILPAVSLRRLCHALFAAYIRLRLLAEARKLLKGGGSRAYGRGAYSTLLRAFYRNGDVLQFRSFWWEAMKTASRERWGPVPRFWHYYRLRFMWKQHPTRAFDLLLWFNEDASLSNIAYTRVRSSLISMASLDVKQKIGAEVEIADANLVLSPGSTDAIRDLCIIALRHSIYTGQTANAGLWFRMNRKRLGNDDDRIEPLDSARRLVFHCGLMARKELNSRDITELFMSAIPLRYPWLNGPTLKVLKQDTTAIAEAGKPQLKSLMTAVAKTNRLFVEAVQCSQRSDKTQVLKAFRQFLASLPLKSSDARATNAIYELIDTLPEPPINTVSLYRPTESEPRIERQDAAQPEPGESSEPGPQPWKVVGPHAHEREESPQEKETTTTSPHQARQPPTLNLVRKHLGGRSHRGGIRAQH